MLRGHATGAAPSGGRARAVGPLQSTVLGLLACPHHGLHTDGKMVDWIVRRAAGRRARINYYKWMIYST